LARPAATGLDAVLKGLFVFLAAWSRHLRPVHLPDILRALKVTLEGQGSLAVSLQEGGHEEGRSQEVTSDSMSDKKHYVNKYFRIFILQLIMSVIH
jgi:hypothetical protein